MSSTEELRKELRIAKNNLLKISKILLHELEIIEPATIALQTEIGLLSERIGYLEAEIWADINNVTANNSGKLRLENALKELRHQLELEKSIFDNEGTNADKLLDINFRVQEIEEALNDIR